MKGRADAEKNTEAFYSGGDGGVWHGDAANYCRNQRGKLLNPLEYIARALSPAQVISITQEDDKTARVIVPDDKLSLAIGKGGQNVRLAAKLTGWKIDVKSYSQAVEDGIVDSIEE